MVITFLPDSSSATMSSVFVLTAKPLLAACSTTSASSAMIFALSFVARTPVGGRPTIVPASTSAFEGLKTKTPTSSSSGSSITSRSWAEPTAPVAHWITRVVTWTSSARRAPRPCRASRSSCRRAAPGEPRGTRSRPVRGGGLVVVPTAGPRTHTNRKSSSAPVAATRERVPPPRMPPPPDPRLNSSTSTQTRPTGPAPCETHGCDSRHAVRRSVLLSRCCERGCPRTRLRCRCEPSPVGVHRAVEPN